MYVIKQTQTTENEHAAYILKNSVVHYIFEAKTSKTKFKSNNKILEWNWHTKKCHRAELHQFVTKFW